MSALRSVRALKIATEDVNAGPTGPAVPLRAMRVLLVDDNADVLETMSAVLATHGASVRCADCADEALRQLSTSSPDVMISDLGMPGRDGFDLVREVRLQHRDMPCLAFTAYGGGDEKARALAAGFNGFALKTVEPRALVALIAAIVPGATTR